MRRTPESGESGTTLVEALVAMAVAAVMAAGVAGLAVLAAADGVAARMRTWQALLALQKLEQLRALAAPACQPGAGSEGSADLGAALAPSPAAALDASLPGFSDRLDAGGRPPGPSDGSAVFVRRWAITPLAGPARGGFGLRVYVTDRAGGARALPRTSAGRWAPGRTGVLLETVVWCG